MVIRQHDIFRGSHDGVGRYVYVLQHTINVALPTVLAAPISEIPAPKIISKLDIPIVVDNRSLHIRTHYLAAIPRSALRSFVENRTEMHDEIIGAIDILFTGF